MSLLNIIIQHGGVWEWELLKVYVRRGVIIHLGTIIINRLIEWNALYEIIVRGSLKDLFIITSRF